MEETEVKVTKTYSISLADVNAVKEIAAKQTTAEGKRVTDADVLHQAIAALYAAEFPQVA
jgi:hypothetical protein